jgi:putative transposase
MIRAKKVTFQTSKENVDRLFACNRESALVWNHCLALSRQSYQDKGEWITKSELQKATKGKYHLHSQSIQAVCHKYLFAREAACQAILKGRKTGRYPYKNKHHYPTKWAKDGFRIHETGKIELSMGIHDRKREKPIVVYTRNMPEGKIKEIELCYDHGLYLSIAFEDGEKNVPYEKKQSVGVDPGEIHTLAAFAETGEAVLLTGRKIRSIHRLRNKKLAAIQRLLSKCKKGSRQWKSYQKVKRYVLSKSEKQLQDALHKTTKQFVDWCVKQGVSDVHMGNPEGVQKNTRKKKRATRKQAQRLSNWSFGKVKKYLQYKLARKGIKLQEVEEAYTSQTCPVCKKRQKVSSRNYRCSCGYHEHRDTHGARNILAKSLYGEMRHFDVSTTQTYLRIA